MNAISVANVAIRQFDNLYSLNDLHKAAGGEKCHQPANWLRSQQAIDLIEYLKSEELESIQKKQGLGPFVSKELVVHYGMWISPAFSLKVIRAFLDTQEEVSGSPKLETQTTIDERRGLVDAVKLLVARCGIDYSAAYRMVHQRFGVAHIDQIAAPLLPAAVAYVHSLTLQSGLNGEVLDRLPERFCHQQPGLRRIYLPAPGGDTRAEPPPGSHPDRPRRRQYHVPAQRGRTGGHQRARQRIFPILPLGWR